jgi:hypothetical protein
MSTEITACTYYTGRLQRHDQKQIHSVERLCMCLGGGGEAVWWNNLSWRETESEGGEKTDDEGKNKTKELIWNSWKSIRGCIQKFPDWAYNEINAYNNKHSSRTNTKGYGDKTH